MHSIKETPRYYARKILTSWLTWRAILYQIIYQTIPYINIKFTIFFIITDIRTQLASFHIDQGVPGWMHDSVIAFYLVDNHSMVCMYRQGVSIPMSILYLEIREPSNFVHIYICDPYKLAPLLYIGFKVPSNSGRQTEVKTNTDVFVKHCSNNFLLLFFLIQCKII